MGRSVRWWRRHCPRALVRMPQKPLRRICAGPNAAAADSSTSRDMCPLNAAPTAPAGGAGRGGGEECDAGLKVWEGDGLCLCRVKSQSSEGTAAQQVWRDQSGGHTAGMELG